MANTRVSQPIASSWCRDMPRNRPRAADLPRLPRPWARICHHCPHVESRVHKERKWTPWTRAVVKRILTSPKYVGDNVWGRTSFKLQIARRSNPSETWVRSDSAFEGIISRDTFDKAQQVRAARAVLLAKTDRRPPTHALPKTGRITARLIKNDGFVSVLCIRKRFGSLIPAYERAGFRPKRDLEFLAHNRSARTLRAATAEAVLAGLRDRFA